MNEYFASQNESEGGYHGSREVKIQDRRVREGRE